MSRRHRRKAARQYRPENARGSMRVKPPAQRFFVDPAQAARPCMPVVSMRRRAPELREAAIAPAARSVVAVADWILEIVILVISLGRPELGRGDDRRHDRFLERLRLLECGLRRFGEPALLVVVHEDRRAVLR